MTLPENTPAQLFNIRIPVWNGGKRMVGLATYKIGNHNEIRILSKNKDGERTYPNPFYISGSKARSYPTEPVKTHPDIILYMIPIADLEVLNRV